MAISSLMLGRFTRLALRSQETWQGGIVRMPTWVENQTDKAGPPFRPLGALWGQRAHRVDPPGVPRQGLAGQ
jgi:hypothetical protein